MWDPGWDKIFKEHEWGKYPPEEVIRVVAKNFFGAKDRSQVSILEIGCGTGANLWFLAREGFRAFGIDGSRVALERAERRLREEGLTAELNVGDAQRLPYADASFDGALDVECLYANVWEDAKKMVAELHRVLKPGGVLLSKSFRTGTHESALKQGYGPVRYTSEEEIPVLYAPFELENYEYLSRSFGDRRREVREWLITCRKKT